MPDRPHRLARLVEVPDPVEQVAVEKWQTLAAMVKQARAGEAGTTTSNGQQFDHRLTCHDG